MPAIASPAEVYKNADIALDTLSNLWQSMLQIIQAVSAASASSLTVEPDLTSLQKLRKEYEHLLTSIKSTVTWLEGNQLLESNDTKIESEEYLNSLKEQEQLQQESLRVTDQLKRMLNQSHALQFQIETFFTSSQDISLG